ncbi:MAG TPA: flagellar basal-body MS-ring/collar protein FliF, partial [Gammaproteobacteria bacterium]|nr:flagellar basal-body MS-ring/collar protein FliF [Gammaproteobacteria bacterium]
MSNWRDNLQRLSTSGQIGLASGLLLIVLLTGGLAYWAFATDYAVLFSDVDSREAAVLVQQLEEMKAPYRLEAGGTRILVPASGVHALRLKLMSDGIQLNSGAGFELFNKAEFGMTEFAQKINYQRALQGELARTIGSVPGVKYARVHLVLPESSLFAEKQTQPKAAVTLILQEGAGIDRRQVQGIQRLVAATVPGLQSGQVTVLDQSGVALGGSSADELEALPERLE